MNDIVQDPMLIVVLVTMALLGAVAIVLRILSIPQRVEDLVRREAKRMQYHRRGRYFIVRPPSEIRWWVCGDGPADEPENIRVITSYETHTEAVIEVEELALNEAW